MARTPTKITKRDIDKDLYLEIVNEASNETNIQKLLDEYVRKDEGISEWQIPTKYRQNITKRLNELDTGIQDIKGDTTQKTWNEDILKRVQTLEKKEGLATDDDGKTSPVIGTQVAANTSGISKNTKQITVLEGRIKELEQKHNDDKTSLLTENDKIKNDVNHQLKSANDRMTSIETSMASKRERGELIKEDDLDESVKKNIRAVLNIGDSTIEALDNLDSVIQRIDGIEQNVNAGKAQISDATTSFKSEKATLEASFTGQIEAVRTAEQNDIKGIQTALDNYKSENDTKVLSLTDQVTAMNTLVTAKDYRIDSINDKVESIAVDQKNNAVNIAGCEDRIEELGTSVNIQKQSLDTTYKSITKSLEKAQMFPQIKKGKLLAVSDSDGSLMGHDIVCQIYAPYDNGTLKNYLQQRVSPIYDVMKDRMFVDLTTKKGSEDDTPATPSDTPTDPASTTEPSGSTDTPSTGDAGTTTPGSGDSTTTSGSDAGTTAGDSGATTAATEGESTSSESAADTTPADSSTDTSASDSDKASDSSAAGDASKTEDTKSEDAKSADASSGEETKSDDAKADDGSATDKKDTDTGSDDQKKTDTPADPADPAEDPAAKAEEEEILKLAKGYQIIENFSSAPENRNMFLLDKDHHSLFAYIDEKGDFQEFGAYSASNVPGLIILNAGSAASFYRNSAAARPPVHVLVKDTNENSVSYGKWINSEGVVTVGYDDSSYTIYNNSASTQEMRVIEG